MTGLSIKNIDPKNVILFCYLKPTDRPIFFHVSPAKQLFNLLSPPNGIFFYLYSGQSTTQSTVEVQWKFNQRVDSDDDAVCDRTGDVYVTQQQIGCVPTRFPKTCWQV